MQDKEVTRAGFGPRAAAYLIDRLLLLIGLACLKTLFYTAALMGASQLITKDFLFRFSALDVICWLASAAYFVLLTFFTGGTLGKKLMRLCVQREDGSPLRFIDTLYRETAGRFLSGILYLGYLMVLADRRHRAFHDWLCDTSIVYSDVTFRRRERTAENEAGGASAPAYSIPGESAVTEAAAAGETIYAVPAPEEAVPEASEPEGPACGDIALEGSVSEAPAPDGEE